MKINTVHCFFEQSGTFKKAFEKYGIKAFDYDICDDFKQTDYVIDLFIEIDKAYKGEKSVFDRISEDDLIFAFFPCVRFENLILLHFKGNALGVRDWSIEKKLEYDLGLFDQMAYLYGLVTKLVLVCLKRKLRLIIENPYSQDHCLHNYWALEPTIIDFDRTFRGDWFKKPTQFFYVNCKPSYNFIFECAINTEKKLVKHTYGVARSLISPVYADRFIREFVLDEEDIKNDDKENN